MRFWLLNQLAKASARVGGDKWYPVLEPEHRFSTWHSFQVYRLPSTDALRQLAADLEQMTQGGSFGWWVDGTNTGREVSTGAGPRDAAEIAREVAALPAPDRKHLTFQVYVDNMPTAVNIYATKPATVQALNSPEAVRIALQRAVERRCVPATRADRKQPRPSFLDSVDAATAETREYERNMEKRARRAGSLSGALWGFIVSAAVAVLSWLLERSDWLGG